MTKICFMKSLNLLKKVVGSISQMYGSGDPDPHQNVTDLQHWFFVLFSCFLHRMRLSATCLNKTSEEALKVGKKD